MKDKFSLAVQTNLTLLDQQYCDIFKKYNVNISTSIDGPVWLHNKYRDPGDTDNHATGFCCKNNFTALLGYNNCFSYHYRPVYDI